MKINTRSPLAELSTDDQLKLVRWLEVKPVQDVVDLIALPRPEGFGIETHVTTLRRFYLRYLKEQRKTDHDLAREFLSSTEGEDDSFRKATVATLQKLAFDISTAPNTKLGQFKALSRWIIKLSDQEHKFATLDLEKQRLDLDIKKFQFNAARSALAHFVELQKIVHDQKMDDEDKVRAARQKMFGASATL